MALDPERVTALVDKWRDVLGVGTEWSLGVKVLERPADLSEEDEDHKEDFAFTDVEEAYFHADITFCAWNFDKNKKDETYLDLVACHEVLHIVMHKLEKLAEAALGNRNEHLHTILTENVVERVSRALVSLQSRARRGRRRRRKGSP